RALGGACGSGGRGSAGSPRSGRPAPRAAGSRGGQAHGTVWKGRRGSRDPARTTARRRLKSGGAAADCSTPPPAGELVAERLGHPHPAPALDDGQERRVRPLVLVGTEARLGAVEDVLVALDRLH